jgi:hypothetical protein
MWLMVVVGCANPALATFLDDRAAAVCDRHTRCDTLADAGFANEAACDTALVAAHDDLAADGALRCASFDQDAADACLAVLADTPCDTTPDLAICDTVCE